MFSKKKDNNNSSDADESVTNITEFENEKVDINTEGFDF